MKNISIIGVGLIGGSLGLALRKRNKKYFITGIGRNPLKLRAAWKLGAIDEYTTDYGEGVRAADIVVICLPVHLIAPAVKKILPFLKPGAVITDAGSVKAPVVKAVNKVLSSSSNSKLLSISFIGAHPMAGSEKSGIKAAKPGLYEGAAVVITKGGSKRAEKEVINMWKGTGAKIVRMDAGSHDRAAAVASHLPHVIAFGLCSLAGKMDRSNPALSKITAGSFRDLTRVADSNPADWASICGANKKELSKAIESFMDELAAVKRILNKPKSLATMFEKARMARNKLIKQDKTQ